MTKEDFLNNRNFIIGHKVKVKSFEEIEKIIDTLKYVRLQHIREFCNREFIVSKLNNDGFEFYREPNENWWTISLPFECFDFTNDNRKPIRDGYELTQKLIDSKLFFFMGTAGEIHGSSVFKSLTSENVFPILNKNGETEIHIGDCCGQVNNALELKIIRTLLDKKMYDASFSTSGSFIRREYHLLNEEQVKRKSFSY